MFEEEEYIAIEDFVIYLNWDREKENIRALEYTYHVGNMNMGNRWMG